MFSLILVDPRDHQISSLSLLQENNHDGTPSGTLHNRTVCDSIGLQCLLPSLQCLLPQSTVSVAQPEKREMFQIWMAEQFENGK